MFLCFEVVDENTFVKIEPSREFLHVSNDQRFISEDLTGARYRQRLSICALAVAIRLHTGQETPGMKVNKLCGRLSSRGKLANASPSVHKCGFN
jgi:hypothetical protein